MPIRYNVLCYCSLQGRTDPLDGYPITFWMGEAELLGHGDISASPIEKIQQMLDLLKPPGINLSVVSIFSEAALHMFEDLEKFDGEIAFRKDSSASLSGGSFDVRVELSDAICRLVEVSAEETLAKFRNALTLATMGERWPELVIVLLSFMELHLTPSKPTYNLVELVASFDMPCVPYRSKDIGLGPGIVREDLVIFLIECLDWS